MYSLTRLSSNRSQAIRRPSGDHSNAPREGEFLFVYPVGDTVDDVVLPSIGGNAAFGAVREVGHEKVVVANEGHAVAVRREGGLLLRPAVESRLSDPSFVSNIQYSAVNERRYTGFTSVDSKMRVSSALNR